MMNGLDCRHSVLNPGDSIGVIPPYAESKSLEILFAYKVFLSL